MVLIDNGSTHSFLDEETDKKLRCELTRTQPLSVTIANGHKVMFLLACVGFCWEMHGETFEIDLRLPKLGCYDILLGLDWIKGVSTISFNFNKMEVTFEKEGWKMSLTGSLERGVCKMITGRKLHKILDLGGPTFLHPCNGTRRGRDGARGKKAESP